MRAGGITIRVEELQKRSKDFWASRCAGVVAEDDRATLGPASARDRAAEACCAHRRCLGQFFLDLRELGTDNVLLDLPLVAFVVESHVPGRVAVPDLTVPEYRHI